MVPQQPGSQSGWLSRHQGPAGFALMFAFTWPIDVWAAADYYGWSSVSIPPILPDFTQPFARQVVGSLNLAIALPLFFLFVVFANGEEIGWRGYAQSRLQARHTALFAGLVVGLVSAFWHIPKFLTAGSAQDYSFSLFILDCISKAIIFAWVNSTGVACGRSPCFTRRSIRPSCSCRFFRQRSTILAPPRSRSVCAVWWRSL
jgi:membrane protease YdiL (CAAX protease family)